MSKNIEMLSKVAKGLGEMINEIVFVGGSVAELYADDVALSDIRATLDVDCVIEISSQMNYYDLEKRLREKGFSNDMTSGAPICRWIYKGTIVDVMPTSGILGFSNKWYVDGISNKIPCVLPDGNQIYIFSTPYYLGSKFEAMLSRGGNDLRTSHDFEDIVFILDNTLDIIKQIVEIDKPIKDYLVVQFRELLNNPNIEEAIECVLPYGAEQRVEVILTILRYDYMEF